MPLVSIACRTCGAQYQFSKESIPAAGYDAQCTQCQTVFFVSLDNVQPVVEQSPPAPDNADILQLHSQEFEIINQVLQETSSQNPATETPLANVFSHDAQTIELQVDRQKAHPVGQEIGNDEPTVMARRPTAPTPTAPQLPKSTPRQEPSEPHSDKLFEITEDDPLASQRSVRLKIWIIGSTLALIVVSYITWRFLLRDANKPIPVAISTSSPSSSSKPNPAKAPAKPQPSVKHELPIGVQQGFALILDDTETSYKAAIAILGQTLRENPNQLEALALAAVAHTWYGADMQLRGYQLLTKPLEKLKPASMRHKTREQKRRLKLELQQAESAKINEAGQLQQEGKKHVEQGLELAQRGMNLAPQSTLLMLTTALCQSALPTNIPKAQEFLSNAQKRLAQHADAQEQQVFWLPAWAALAEGLLHNNIQAFQDALTQLPHLQRARFNLALLLFKQAQIDPAKQQLQTLLASVPNHTKAHDLLEQLSTYSPNKVNNSKVNNTKVKKPQRKRHKRP